MAAYAESDRVQIRIYVGYSAIFLQADPRLENAITATLATTDGGTRPDNSTQTAVMGYITQLQGIDQNLTNLNALMGAGAVDEIRIDPAREMARLRMEGRRLVHRLCRFFDVQPYSDIFSTAPPDILPSPGYDAAPFNNRTPY